MAPSLVPASATSSSEPFPRNAVQNTLDGGPQSINDAWTALREHVDNQVMNNIVRWNCRGLDIAQNDLHRCKQAQIYTTAMVHSMRFRFRFSTRRNRCTFMYNSGRLWFGAYFETMDINTGAWNLKLFDPRGPAANYPDAIRIQFRADLRDWCMTQGLSCRTINHTWITLPGAGAVPECDQVPLVIEYCMSHEQNRDMETSLGAVRCKHVNHLLDRHATFKTPLHPGSLPTTSTNTGSALAGRNIVCNGQWALSKFTFVKQARALAMSPITTMKELAESWDARIAPTMPGVGATGKFKIHASIVPSRPRQTWWRATLLILCDACVCNVPKVEHAMPIYFGDSEEGQLYGILLSHSRGRTTVVPVLPVYLDNAASALDHVRHDLSAKLHCSWWALNEETFSDQDKLGPLTFLWLNLSTLGPEAGYVSRHVAMTGANILCAVRRGHRASSTLPLTDLWTSFPTVIQHLMENSPRVKLEGPVFTPFASIKWKDITFRPGACKRPSARPSFWNED